MKSAAVGVACAGQLYFSATFAIALILALLRFGPRQPPSDDDDEDDHEFDLPEHSVGQNNTPYQAAGITIAAGTPDNLSSDALDSETQPLKGRQDAKSVASINSAGPARKRRSNAASLGGIL